MSLPQDGWKLVVNTNYQEVMKTLMSLTTASLVLPFLFIRNFLGVPEGKRLADYLPRSAYWFWGLMFLSLLCDMVFFWASAKFVKVVSGGAEAWSENFFEGLRDAVIKGASLSFVAALVAFAMLVWKVLHRG
jgi:hypothetical protein